RERCFHCIRDGYAYYESSSGKQHVLDIRQFLEGDRHAQHQNRSSIKLRTGQCQSKPHVQWLICLLRLRDWIGFRGLPHWSRKQLQSGGLSNVLWPSQICGRFFGGQLEGQTECHTELWCALGSDAVLVRKIQPDSDICPRPAIEGLSDGADKPCLPNG